MEGLIAIFQHASLGVLYSYTSEQCPADIRAFGSGWASAIGRVGGIVAPLVVTHIMATWQDAFSSVFLMFTGVLLFVAIIIILLGEETRGRTLEAISR